MLKKQFVEHGAVSGVAGWGALSVSQGVQGLAAALPGFVVLCYQSAPVPRQGL